MHKRWLLLLISALVVLGGYLYLRISLQTTIQQEEQQTGEVMPAKDTLDGKKVTQADLRPLFIRRLQQLLRHSTQGLYDLSVGDLQVDVLASTVSLQQVVMRPNAQTLEALKKSGQLPAAVYTVSIKSLVIEGINLDDAVTSKTMDYKLVKVVNPVIEINQITTKVKKVKRREDSAAFAQRFLHQMQKLDIKKLIVEGGAIVTYKGGRKTNRLNQVQVNMTNILLNDSTRTDPQRFLFAKAATISFRNYQTQTKDGLYHLKVGRVTVKEPQQQVRLHHLSVASLLSKEQFVKRHPHSQEMYRLQLPSVTLNSVDWWTLINEEEVVADEMVTEGGKLLVYFDRSRPLRSRMGKFPNQLLMKAPVKLHIDRLKVRNLAVSYEEYNPVSQQSGTVHLGRVAIAVNNLSNRNRKPVEVEGTALLMHRIPIQARFRFDMANHRQGRFTARINTKGGFDGTLLNSFAMPLGLVQIKEGKLQKVQATVTGDQWQAAGNVLMLYEDLKLALLEKDNNKTELDKKDVTSFLANTFVLKKNNPPEGKEPRRATVTFERIPEGGFFLLVWKTMLAGALKTIGAPEKIASQTAAEKNQE